MDFLVIISGVLVLFVCQTLAFIQYDQWYRWFVRRVHQVLGAHAVLSYLLSLLVPVLLLLLLEGVVSAKMFGLTGYFLGLFVLLYAFGRGNLDTDVSAYRDALQRDDLQAAYHDSSAFNEAHHESEATTWQQLHSEVTANVAYRYFEHYFAVIFWYLLAGPAGALLYRLAQLHLDDELDRGQSLSAARRFLWLLEWVPVRLFGITLAIVGNFSSTVTPWLESLVDFSSQSARVMQQLVCGALDVDYSEAGQQSNSKNVLEITAIQGLFHRALGCTLCLVALVVIFV